MGLRHHKYCRNIFSTKLEGGVEIERKQIYPAYQYTEMKGRYIIPTRMSYKIQQSAGKSSINYKEKKEKEKKKCLFILKIFDITMSTYIS